MEITAPSLPTLPPPADEAKPDAAAPAAAQDTPAPSDAPATPAAAQDAPPPSDADGAPVTPDAPADNAPTPYRSPLLGLLPDPGVASQLMQVPATAQRSDSVQPRQGETSANPDNARDQNGNNPQDAASGGGGNPPQTGMGSTNAATAVDAGAAGSVPVDPRETVSPPTPAAVVNATNAAAPTAAPTAPREEIAMYELMLANPDIQDVIKNFGGPLEPARTKNGVEKSMVERYGPDLTARLNQLRTAQQEVRKQYSEALHDAEINAGPNQPGSVLVVNSVITDANGSGWSTRYLDRSGNPTSPPAFTKDSVGFSESVFGNDSGYSSSWVLDHVAFTNAWAKGDSALQKAFTTLYGDEPLQVKTEQRRETYAEGAVSYSTETYCTLAGQNLTYDDNLVDPKDPPSMYDKSAVWFDPGFGWITDPSNVKEESDWFDKAMSTVFGTAMGLMTGGALSSLGVFGSVAGDVSARQPAKWRPPTKSTSAPCSKTSSPPS